MWLTDGRTDERTTYHNTSEVLLRAYKKSGGPNDPKLPYAMENPEKIVFNYIKFLHLIYYGMSADILGPVRGGNVVICFVFD